ncbi:MAG: hypothetical protein NXH85_05120 [Pseudomonadaceae bacterium]|nr:hypothetical protein [Pseudomonadaceae bacterium]
MSLTPSPLCPDPSSLLPHTGSMRLLSSVLGWSGSELVGRIDVTSSSYLTGKDGASGTLATEYLAQCSAALFTVLALSSEAEAKPRPGMLIASRSLELSRPTFTPGAWLGFVRAESSLPSKHSGDAILVRFAGTLSTLSMDNPQDAPMLQHVSGYPPLPIDELRKRSNQSIIARADFSVYLPAIDAEPSSSDNHS